MKTMNRRIVVWATTSALFPVSFILFNQVRNSARAAPRYVVEKTQLLSRSSQHNGKTYDRQINVVIKEGWPFYARLFSDTSTSWGLAEEWISFRYKGRERGDGDVWEKLVPPKKAGGQWIVIYQLNTAYIPKSATDVFFTSKIIFTGNRSGKTTLPVKIRLRQGVLSK